MPEVSFIGSIDSTCCKSEVVSVTWGIVPGSSAWSLRSGEDVGESQSALFDEGLGRAVLNHPIDVVYETSSTEGWPFIVCEVWDKSNEESRGFIGCGNVWLPPLPGKHSIEVPIWRPTTSLLGSFVDTMVPNVPDLKKLRELMVSPYMKSQVKVIQIMTLFFVVVFVYIITNYILL